MSFYKLKMELRSIRMTWKKDIYRGGTRQTDGTSYIDGVIMGLDIALKILAKHEKLNKGK